MSIKRSPKSDGTSIIRDNKKNDEIEITLRPRSLEEYVWQSQLKKNLNIFIKAAKQRWESLEHMLFYWPPWLWKTTLAYIISSEMWTNIRSTSGPAIEKAWDLAAVLTNLKEWEILFIDEIHRLKPNVEEILYSAMEDSKLDIIIWKGPWARSMSINLPSFTLIWATTKLSSLSSPLRDRFWNISRLDFYSDEEIEHIIRRSARILSLESDNPSLKIVSRCCRQTPRIANRLLKSLRDFASVYNGWVLSEKIVLQWLSSLWIDKTWLDNIDKHLLQTIIEKFNWWPVWLSTIAVAISEEQDTVENVYEPYLIKLWFIKRTAKGRVITQNAYEYLWLKY